MSKEININSLDELINFINQDKTTMHDALKLIEIIYTVFADLEEWKSKEEIIERLIYYNENYYCKPISDRPIFFVGKNFLHI